MIILNEKPPIWEECNKLFTLKPGVVFTYGGTIYNPDNVSISADLMVHEQCHAKQQEYNNVVAHLWWMRYLEDPQFRLEQEVAAYASQYRYICAQVKDKNKRNGYLTFMARTLSGPLYKCDVSYFSAVQAIKVGRLDTKTTV